MSYTVERLPREPIILITLSEGNLEEEIPAIHQKTKELAKNIIGTAYRIVDMRPANLSFTQVVFALKEGSKKRSGGVADQKFKSFYVIGEHQMNKLLTESLAQEQYGGIQVKTTETTEQALEQVRALVTS